MLQEIEAIAEARALGRAQGRDPALPWRADLDARRRRATCSERDAGLHGFYGASSMERLPAEIAPTEQTRKFGMIAC